MRTVTSLVRATNEQLDHFVTHPDQIHEFLWQRKPLDPPSGYLDQSIYAIQAMLNASDVRLNLSPDFLPGKPIYHGRDIYFALYSPKIREMLTVLAPVSPEVLAANFSDEDCDYALYHYGILIKFLAHAAHAKLGAVMCHN